MGTRSSVIVLNENKDKIINLYRQFDGYPEGMGKDIFNVFGNIKLTNGFNSDQEQENCWANGMEDLAEMVVCEIKNQCKTSTKFNSDTYEKKQDYDLLGIGNVYLYPVDFENEQSYKYVIYPVDYEDENEYKKVYMSCTSSGEKEPMYDGPMSGFGDWLDSLKDEEQ